MTMKPTVPIDHSQPVESRAHSTIVVDGHAVAFAD
jgi:hypothetical protein